MPLTDPTVEDTIDMGVSARTGRKNGFQELVITGALALDYTNASDLNVSAAGAQDVTLEGSADVDPALDGMERRVTCIGVADLTLKSFSGATVATLQQFDSCELCHDAKVGLDGVVTGSGWKIKRVTVVALS